MQYIKKKTLDWGLNGWGVPCSNSLAGEESEESRVSRMDSIISTTYVRLELATWVGI